MFVAAVVDDQVHHQLDAALMHALQQVVEILHGAKLFHDVAVIADVVTVVVIRRAVDRLQPDDVHAQVFADSPVF